MPAHSAICAIAASAICLDPGVTATVDAAVAEVRIGGHRHEHEQVLVAVRARRPGRCRSGLHT